MADFILVDGDTVSFDSVFAPAIVAVRPGTISGSGKMTYQGKKVCVEGDEQGVSVPSCAYYTPVYSIAGIGTLTIEVLSSDQKARKTKSENNLVLLKGSVFTAKFEVQQPAQQPPPGPGSPTPDPTPQYSGTGMFMTMNTLWQGT